MGLGMCMSYNFLLFVKCLLHVHPAPKMSCLRRCHVSYVTLEAGVEPLLSEFLHALLFSLVKTGGGMKGRKY